MKKLLFLLMFLYAVVSNAQNIPDAGLNKVRISLPDKTIVADIDPVSGDPKPKASLFYYWYSANEVHATQGGYSGKLINGLYTEYYPNKNLKEQGHFKNGLKNGIWKSWNENGTLAATSQWRFGLDITNDKSTIWRRINIFKKPQNHPVTDTLKKP